MPMDRKPIILLVAVILVAGVTAAGFFGSIAGLAYGMQLETRAVSVNRPVYLTGRWWGAFTGLIAGAIWCRVMVPAAIRSRGRRLTGGGALAGLGAGILSTILLHAVLMIVAIRPEPTTLAFVLPIGLACGVVAGLIAGAICGIVCGAAVRRTLRATAAAGDDGAE